MNKDEVKSNVTLKKLINISNETVKFLEFIK